MEVEGQQEHVAPPLLAQAKSVPDAVAENGHPAEDVARADAQRQDGPVPSGTSTKRKWPSMWHMPSKVPGAYAAC